MFGLPAKKRVAAVLIAGVATLTTLAATAPAPAFTNGLPDAMAAIGDSITLATNLDSNHLYSNPDHSWSTGYNAGDVVVSHYERIKAVNSKITNRNYNHAENGAEMADALAQANAIVARGNVEYVTIQLGGNDLCASTVAGMTPTATYESQFRAAMNALTTGLPNAKIYVSSVPNVHRLWDLFKYDFDARWRWDLYDICQSLLDENGSSTTRAQVKARNIEYNTVLKNVCATYTKCKFDNNAVFNWNFAKGDISGVDYFHPSMNGQKNLAQVSWSAGYWPTV